MAAYPSDLPTAKQALKSSLSAIKAVGGGVDDIDAEVARNILNEDLGNFSGSYLTNYALDDETRDRLIAHARQDAAHAVVLCSRLSRELRVLKRMLYLVIFALILAVWNLF
jgi:hypothetical protein